MIPPALFLSYRNPGPRARPACQAHLGSLESHGRGGVQFMPPPDITEMLCHQPEVTCHASGSSPVAWMVSGDVRDGQPACSSAEEAGT